MLGNGRTRDFWGSGRILRRSLTSARTISSWGAGGRLAPFAFAPIYQRLLRFARRLLPSEGRDLPQERCPHRQHNRCCDGRFHTNLLDSFDNPKCRAGQHKADLSGQMNRERPYGGSDPDQQGGLQAHEDAYTWANFAHNILRESSKDQTRKYRQQVWLAGLRRAEDLQIQRGHRNFRVSGGQPTRNRNQEEWPTGRSSRQPCSS